MKKWLLCLLLLTGCTLNSFKASAQWEELQQLALDIEKLAQMKSILQEMYKGYQILTGGYNTIKDLAQGNFNLHNTFLTGLLSINPTIKNYVRVADIIQAQANLVAEYKKSKQQFIKSGAFSPSELNYIATVYSNLVDKSLDNLDELVMVLTSNSLRMSDAERLTAIDRIYDDMQDKVNFLRQFNSRAATLGSQRQLLLQDNATLKSLFGQ